MGDTRQAKIPALDPTAHSWQHPPVELLDLIFSRLPSFADRACCTGVCRVWRSVAREMEHAAPPLLPCLLRPSTSGASCFHFFSGTSKEQPAVPAARFCGTIAGGWFVIARHQWRGYELLNLASGARIVLADGVLVDGIPTAEPRRVGLHASSLLIHAATAFPAPIPDDHRGFFVVAIDGKYKALMWQPGCGLWVPIEPLEGDPGRTILLEDFEDVIHYDCDQSVGFFFLTSHEHLMVFDIEPAEQDGGLIPYADLNTYLFPDHLPAPSPEDGHVVAGRYLVESEGRLLMVKRFVSPGLGTVSFQIFRLEWDENLDPRWELSPAAIVGKLFFVGRGCSRAIPTGRSGPGYIYFLDDAEGFPDVQSIASTDKEYRCSDTGWCRYDTQFVRKNWPRGPPANCSPWTWLYH